LTGTSCNLVRLRRILVPETNCSQKSARLAAFRAVEFHMRVQAVLLKAAATHTSTQISTVQQISCLSLFFKPIRILIATKVALHSGRCPRCVASRSLVGGCRRQTVGGRVSYGTFCRPLVRVLIDALASDNLVRILHRLLSDCGRWMGDLTTRDAGRLLNHPPSAVWEPVYGEEWCGFDRLVPVRVRT